MKIKALLIISLLINAIFFVKYFSKSTAKSKLQTIAADERLTPYVNGRDQIFKYLPVTSNDTVFLGDSHTQNFPIDEYFKGHRFLNRGIMGDNTSGVAKRLTQVTSGKPKMIVLMIGINDLIHKTPTNTVLANVLSIVKSIRTTTPNTKLVLEALYPNGTRVSSDTIIRFNSVLQAAASVQNLKYLDLYRKLSLNGKLNPAYDCGDHLHLNGVGYNVISNELKRNLNIR